MIMSPEDALMEELIHPPVDSKPIRRDSSDSSFESLYSKQARLTGLKYKHTKGFSPNEQA